MKSSSLWIALQLAPWALAAPVALPQILRLEPGPLDPPHPRTLAGKRWKFGHPKTAPEVIGTGEVIQDNHLANRPLGPSSSFNPSKVLDSMRPLSTELLLALGLGTKTQEAKDRTHGADSEIRPPVDDYSAQHRLDVEESFEISEFDIEIAIPTTSRLGTPCRYARLSRERDDMLVVLLAAAFLFVVLVMESWGLMWRSVNRIFGWQGAIRLEDDVEEQGGPLSIQADVDAAFKDGNDEKADDVRIEAECPAEARCVLLK